MTARLVVGWLYPDLMNIYGDRGNIVVLASRARWRGIEVEVRQIGIGPVGGLDEVDLLFFGGGQDREQELVFQDLVDHKAAQLEAAVERGAVVLAVCGGFQLLGHHYMTAGGRKLPGLGLLDLHTEAGSTRCIGDVVLETDPSLGLTPSTLVGFENHSGRTFLGRRARPLGRVLSGHGNNDQDGQEGAICGSALGTYLHGSLLPKNPHLADLLIERALGRELAPLDDELELAAHRRVAERTLRR
jgi:CobQ-like glutamine amidotransferase family enzyme